MAASPWTFYNLAKKHLMDGNIDLDSNSFRMSLYTSASNVASVYVSVLGDLNNEVTEAFGYSSSGKPLAGVTWAVGASATEYRFNCAPTQWVAAGGNISAIKYAVIWQAAGSPGAQKLLCYTQLSTVQFTVTSGNSLTITPSANGIFELN
jgi:hypothetical protein